MVADMRTSVNSGASESDSAARPANGLGASAFRQLHNDFLKFPGSGSSKNKKTKNNRNSRSYTMPVATSKKARGSVSQSSIGTRRSQRNPQARLGKNAHPNAASNTSTRTNNLKASTSASAALPQLQQLQALQAEFESKQEKTRARKQQVAKASVTLDQQSDTLDSMRAQTAALSDAVTDLLRALRVQERQHRDQAANSSAESA